MRDHNEVNFIKLMAEFKVSNTHTHMHPFPLVFTFFPSSWACLVYFFAHSRMISYALFSCIFYPFNSKTLITAYLQWRVLVQMYWKLKKKSVLRKPNTSWFSWFSVFFSEKILPRVGHGHVHGTVFCWTGRFLHQRTPQRWKTQFSQLLPSNPSLWHLIIMDTHIQSNVVRCILTQTWQLRLSGKKDHMFPVPWVVVINRFTWCLYATCRGWSGDWTREGFVDVSFES